MTGWFPEVCSFCGHRADHPHPCTGTIAVRRGRPPVEGTIPCPCQRANFGKTVDGGADVVVDARETVDCKAAAPEARQRIEGLSTPTTVEGVE